MKRVLMLTLTLLWVTLQVNANPPAGRAGVPARTLRALDAHFQQVQKDWELPGMAVGIVYNGQLIFSKGYGVKETGKAESPDANTLFAIASNTKAFTAVLMGMLVQDGLLSWDDNVKDHLPYFEIFDPWVSSQVTLRDLLCHRVGLGTFSGDVIWYKSAKTSKEIIKRLRHLPQVFDFRAGYGYSNLMYIVAGEVIEQVTGKSWEENVRKRILEPLGMNRTIVKLKDLEFKGNYASPHARINNQNMVIDWVDWEEVAATGGLISSINDMARWMQFNMNMGVWNGDTLLSRRNLNLIWTPHNSFPVDHTRINDFNRHFSGYGLGWGLGDYHGRLVVGHTGGYDGMISEVRMLPKEGIGVIVLTNGAMSPIGPVTNHTLETLLGKTPRDWSAEALPRARRRFQEDERITAIRNARIGNTTPTLPIERYAGNYFSAIYGNIYVRHEKDQLRVTFEHSPGLSANLRHWHYDVWEILWDEPQAWFGFGTLQFNIDNKLHITGLTFDVPNRDIFFEELKPLRVQ
jgi:CubicO group peptidase (beta-lactamase class C family)